MAYNQSNILSPLSGKSYYNLGPRTNRHLTTNLPPIFNNKQTQNISINDDLNLVVNESRMQMQYTTRNVKNP